MIDNHRDRVIYLCNYLLKNYYRKMNLVGDYTVERIKTIHDEWWKQNYPIGEGINKLPFDEDDKFFSSTDDVQVIINGHRYNLS